MIAIRRMETTVFFEKKVSLTPSDLNKVKSSQIDTLLLQRAKEMMENCCSEQGFVLPGSIQLLSRSMGYFEAARFTGDVNYYVKLEGKVIYPVDGVRVKGEVIRKNKMGLYVDYKKAIRIQVPRDLHIGSIEYDHVQLGDIVDIELKRSKFAIHDPYILASGVFHSVSEKKLESRPASPVYDEKEEPIEQAQLQSNQVQSVAYKATIKGLPSDQLLQEYKTERNPALRALLQTEIEQRGLSVPDLNIYDEKKDSVEQKSNRPLSTAEVEEQARLRAIRSNQDTVAGYKATIEGLEPDQLLQEYTTERNPAFRALLRTEIEQRGLSVPDL